MDLQVSKLQPYICPSVITHQCYLQEGCICEVKFPVQGLEGTADNGSLDVILDPLGHNFLYDLEMKLRCQTAGGSF